MMKTPGFEKWVKEVETLLGHSLNGDQKTDGYSLDEAHKAFCATLTPIQYAAWVLIRRGA